MKHLALYRKWRPQRFGEVVGQEHISRTLLNAIRQDRLAHAYLFCGPRGTGKTTSARLLAKALNCLNSQDGEPCNTCANCEEITAGHSLDVIEIDAASNRGIDSARELREQVRFSASGGRYRVFIIDEFHMLTKEAFNALLKTLEEPPEKVIFVLATTEPHEVLQTVISRCQRFDFQRIATRAMAKHLQQVATAENIGVSAPAIEAMARKANGGLRDGLSLLDQVRAIGMPGEALPDPLVYQTLGLVQEDELLALLTAAFNGEPEPMLANLRKLLEQGHDALQVLAELIQLLRHLTLASLPPERLESLGVPSHLLTAVIELGRRLSRGQIVTALDLLLRTSDRLHHCAQPDIWLEADLLCLCLQGERSLLQRLEALEQGAPRSLPAAAAAPRPETRPEPRPEVRPEVRQDVVRQDVRPEPVSAAPQPVSVPEPVQADTGPEPVWVPDQAPDDFGPRPVVNLQDLSGLWRAFLERVKETQRPLIGFLLNGKLAQVSTSRKVWIVEFNSRTHCEKIRERLKNGTLQQLVSEIMAEPYGIEARMPDEEKKTTSEPERAPEPVKVAASVQESRPIYDARPPVPEARAPEPQLSQAAPEPPVLAPIAQPEPRPQPRFEEDIDMDYLPDEAPMQAAQPVAPSYSPPAAVQAQAAPVAEPQPQSLSVATRERSRPPERAAEPVHLENVSAPRPSVPSAPPLSPPLSPPLASPEPVIESSFARKHPVEAVAELFKGKIIHRR